MIAKFKYKSSKGWDINIFNKNIIIAKFTSLMNVPVTLLLGVKPHIKVFGYYIFIEKEWQKKK